MKLLIADTTAGVTQVAIPVEITDYLEPQDFLDALDTLEIGEVIGTVIMDEDIAIYNEIEREYGIR